MELIRRRIKCISQSLPMESTSTNIMRHILKVIRDEFEVAAKVNTNNTQEENLIKFLTEKRRISLSASACKWGKRHCIGLF